MKEELKQYQGNGHYTVTLLAHGESSMDYISKMELEEVCEQYHIPLERITRIATMAYMCRVFITSEEQFNTICGLPFVYSMKPSTYAVLDNAIG